MNSFDIKYSDGSIDKVKRVKRDKLKDLIILQQEILYYFFKNQANIGATLAELEAWNCIRKISKLLPVIGEEKLGINLDKLDEDNDLEQIALIFITTAIQNEDGGFLSVNEHFDTSTWYEPSLISKLHQLNYKGDSGEALKKIQKEVQEEVPKE